MRYANEIPALCLFNAAVLGIFSDGSFYAVIVGVAHPPQHYTPAIGSVGHRSGICALSEP